MKAKPRFTEKQLEEMRNNRTAYMKQLKKDIKRVREHFLPHKRKT